MNIIKISTRLYSNIYKKSFTPLNPNRKSEINLLTRDYIHYLLYNNTTGYFQSKDILYSPTLKIDFNNLWGKWEYLLTLKKLYNKESAAWLTPVEIFAPYYSFSIAKYIINCIKSLSGPFEIIEVGGGAGTNARYILDYIHDNEPDLYKNTTYTLIEISKTLAERQKKTLSESHESSKFNIINQDFLNYKPKNVKNGIIGDVAKSFVIALEVMDNLPHDKITMKQDGKLYQTIIKKTNIDVNDEYEYLEPLNDRLILDTLNYFPIRLPLKHKPPENMYEILKNNFKKVLFSGYNDKKIINSEFIPTGCYNFLYTVKKLFPKSKLIIADFNQLPEPTFKQNDHKSLIFHHKNSLTTLSTGSLAARNAPLVASKSKGITFDHITYLIKPGEADIFFATDFERLKSAFCLLNNRPKNSVQVLSSKNFLKQYANLEQTRTISGYNPLIEDYSNTSFMLT